MPHCMSCGPPCSQAARNDRNTLLDMLHIERSSSSMRKCNTTRPSAGAVRRDDRSAPANQDMKWNDQLRALLTAASKPRSRSSLSHAATTFRASGLPSAHSISIADASRRSR